MAQTKRLYELLLDGKPHRTDEICREVYGDEHLGVARIGARIWDIKKKYCMAIKSWRDEVKKTLWWYQIDGHPTEVQNLTFGADGRSNRENGHGEVDNTNSEDQVKPQQVISWHPSTMININLKQSVLF